MKIQLLSDLHLEHSHRHPPLVLPASAADVVVLAGDIDNGTNAFDWAERTFPGQTVLYVPGNHEYYDTDFEVACAELRARARHSANVRLLDNCELTINGVRFVGTTLWTDFELTGTSMRETIMAQSVNYVADFRKIRFGGGLLTPRQTIGLHRDAVAFLRDALDRPFPGKTVVVTHHAPHPGSVHPRWAGNPLNAAFVSNLTRLMGKSVLWLHGHTHDSFDYSVHGTRVRANPMGYRNSNPAAPGLPAAAPAVSTENRRFDPALLLEI